MINIKLVEDTVQKSAICNDILRSLPNWFGVEESIIDYVNKVRLMPLWAALDCEEVVGFLALKTHNIYTSEISVMGVLPEYHRSGIGRQLIENCEQFCLKSKTEFLTVKTLDDTVASNSYSKTRNFYLSLGFRPLEVFPLHWDENNPCLFMAKYLSE